MSFKELEGFLNDKEDGQEIDWEVHKTFWLEAVNEFYSNVSAWLESLVGKSLTYGFETMVLNEEYIGSYESKRMKIYAKGQKVIIEPKGTLITGAKGRIDMVGGYGNVRFIYVDNRLTRPNISVNIIDPAKKDALKEQSRVYGKEAPVKYEWKVATLPPNIQFIPLNEETFSNALLSVIRYG